MTTKSITISAGGYHCTGTLTQTGGMHRATLEMQEVDAQGDPVVAPYDTGNHNMESGATMAIRRWLADRYGETCGKIQITIT